VARGRWLATAAAAVAFGVGMAVIKGQDAGARDALGNLSAPWVVLAFVAGAGQRTLWRGVAAGVLATLVAFAGFYAAEAFVLDLGTGSLIARLRLTLGSGHVYETWGVPSGVAFGLLGSAWRVRPAWRIGALVPALAFVTEPLIVYLLTRIGVWGGGLLFAHRWLWMSEMLLGLGATAVIIGRELRKRPPDARSL
jgi:hypothetical protein